MYSFLYCTFYIPFASSIPILPGQHMKFSTGFHSFMESDKSKYYRYHGSMTHPPCSEIIIWTLFGPTGNLSLAQVMHIDQLMIKWVLSNACKEVIQPI